MTVFLQVPVAIDPSRCGAAYLQGRGCSCPLADSPPPIAGPVSRRTLDSPGRNGTTIDPCENWSEHTGTPSLPTATDPPAANVKITQTFTVRAEAQRITSKTTHGNSLCMSPTTK